jgi:hypothetical protein
MVVEEREYLLDVPTDRVGNGTPDKPRRRAVHHDDSAVLVGDDHTVREFLQADLHAAPPAGAAAQAWTARPTPPYTDGDPD